MSDESKKTTDFGYQKIPVEQKGARVRGLFDAVSPRYDLMNDVLSLGLHRLWKRAAVEFTALRPGEQVLDVAAGTGDFALLLARQCKAQVTLVDPSQKMLASGRDALLAEGIVAPAVCAEAEHLPFANAAFDCVTVSFGLRNFTDKTAALKEMTRCIKPGGRLLVLEFSHPHNRLLRRAYDTYSFRVMPKLGQVLAGDGEPYRYLAESIRVHPDRDTLLQLMRDAGLEQCQYRDMTGGVVAVHWGVRRA